jgi:heptosyltransferase-2
MKIVIRATNWVGDAIMALPALRAVRRRYPDAEISVVARPYVADIYRDQGICDHLIPYDSRGVHADMAGRAQLIRELRSQRFDAALLLQNAFGAAWLAWRAGIPERIGYARDGRTLLLTRAIPAPNEGEIPKHEMYYYLELLRRAGWVDSLETEEEIELRVTPERREKAAAILSTAGARSSALRVAIGAGASYGSAKCWMPERFGEFATRCQQERDADVILFGTAGEIVVAEAIKAGMPRQPIDLTGKTEIADLPALLAQCHLFVGNDSGAMHVAAAVGLPVVAIFGPTDPLGTSPMTQRRSIVQNKPYCSPCFLRRCPTDHRCMRAISSSAVYAAAEPWLAIAGVRPA